MNTPLILQRAVRVQRICRWRLRGLRMPLSSIVHPTVCVTNPSQITIGPHARVAVRAYLKCMAGRITLAERAYVGEGSWINAQQLVEIGAGALIGPGCHITDANHGVEGTQPIWQQPAVAKPVSIGEGSWLGAGVKITAGVTIGRGAVVGAGAVVTRSVPDYAIAVGVPARVVGSRTPGSVDAPGDEPRDLPHVG